MRYTFFEKKDAPIISCVSRVDGSESFLDFILEYEKDRKMFPVNILRGYRRGKYWIII